MSKNRLNDLEGKRVRDRGELANNSRWERQRKKDPVLQLLPIADDLAWLFAGEPDPEVSLDFWVLCSDENDVTRVGEYLLEFWNGHPATFLHSGWVSDFVGRVILADKNAAQRFIKTYWKKARPSESRNNAYRALRIVQGKHQAHWVRSASFMRTFLSQPRAKENDSRFIARAIEAFNNDKRKSVCSCLAPGSLEKIAQAALNHPNKPPSLIVDYALARTFKTSHGTLAHLRAKINSAHKRRS